MPSLGQLAAIDDLVTALAQAQIESTRRLGLYETALAGSDSLALATTEIRFQQSSALIRGIERAQAADASLT